MEPTAGAAPGKGKGRSLYRHLDFRYVVGLVGGSTRRVHESGGRSWRTFRRLMGYPEYLEPRDSEGSKAWALIGFSHGVARQKVVWPILFAGKPLLYSIFIG